MLPTAGKAPLRSPRPVAVAAPTLEDERGGGTRHGETTGERLRGSEFLLLTTTRFFGREAEIARPAAMLATPRTRLVTLSGPGGSGKSRLALELAAHLVEAPPGEAPSSAVFVALADVLEPERLFEVILRSQGILPIPGRGPRDQLVAALASRPGTLLILENFEQLVEEGAVLIRALLARTAVKLLVTSRQKLRIEGEHECRLAPLPMPVVSGPWPVASGDRSRSDLATDHWQLATNASVALFVDRAQAARSINPGAVATRRPRADGRHPPPPPRGAPLVLRYRLIPSSNRPPSPRRINCWRQPDRGVCHWALAAGIHAISPAAFG
jgi:hypothetical protein